MAFSKKSIEIKDKNINKKMCKLINKIERNIVNLKNVLEKGAPGDKIDDASKLIKEFLEAHRDLELISVDILQIENSEAQEKGFVTLNDQGFLRDKHVQVRKMKRILNELIEMLEAHPTDQELEKDLLERMIKDVNDLIESMNSIINDDKELLKMYKKVA